MKRVVCGILAVLLVLLMPAAAEGLTVVQNGENIQISGKLSEGGKLVSVTVYAPSGKISSMEVCESDRDGNFSFLYPLADSESGTYTVTASAKGEAEQKGTFFCQVNSGNKILSFQINGTHGVFSGNRITVTVDRSEMCIRDSYYYAYGRLEDIRICDDTYVFAPAMKEDGTYDEKLATVTNRGYFSSSNSAVNFKMAIYDIDKGGTANAILVMDTATKGFAQEEWDVVVVDKIIPAIDKEGNEIEQLQGKQNGSPLSWTIGELVTNLNLRCV